MNPTGKGVIGRFLAAAIGVAASAAMPAIAWDPPMRVRVVDEAIRFMPASLRLALETHREDVRRGMIEPMTEEDGLDHVPPWLQGSLDASVSDAADGLVAAISTSRSFSEIARRLGRLGHFVSDAAFPPGASGARGERRGAHFASFASSRLPKFPLVFLGHDDHDLARGDFRAFATRVADEARREDEHLARAYAAAGWPPPPEAFDDRSVPFAVASLSYSRTVNYVVRAWLEAWRRAGGDTGKTPYVKVPSAVAVEEEPPILLEIEEEVEDRR